MRRHFYFQNFPMNKDWRMDKAFFLVTDMDLLDGSHQLVHRLSKPKFNSIVYAIVPDFNILKNMREEFFDVNFLFLDIARSETVTKELLVCLPEMDCIVNYSDEHLTNVLTRLRDMRVSKTSVHDADEINIRLLHEELETNPGARPGLVLINAKTKEQHEQSGSEALVKLKFKEEKLRNEEADFLGKNIIKFRPGRRFRQVGPPPSSPSVSPEQYTSASSTPSSPLPPLFPVNEMQPLLGTRTQDRTTSQKNLIDAWICSWMSCCIFRRTPKVPPSPEVPTFETEEDLRNFIRGEHHLVLRRKLKRFVDSAEEEWYRVMTRMDKVEVFKVENLTIQLKAKKLQAIKELDWRTESEKIGKEMNRNGRMSDGEVDRLTISREKQAERIREWDTTRELEDGITEIRKVSKIERDLVENKHYTVWVQRELEILRYTKDKTRRRFVNLYEQTFKRDAPFECIF